MESWGEGEAEGVLQLKSPQCVTTTPTPRANLSTPLNHTETVGSGSRTILFTVETQEELRRGFYPSISVALG